MTPTRVISGVVHSNAAAPPSRSARTITNSAITLRMAFIIPLRRKRTMREP
jgi:hypothetical protein